MGGRQERSEAAQEAREGARRERDGVPGHLISRARPRGGAGGRDDPLNEGAVEARVVGDDEVRCGEELGRGRDVDSLAREVLAGEARDVRDLGWDRPARVLAPGAGLVAVDVGDRALEGVREREHRELDERIVLGAEAGCFAVDIQAAPARARAGRVRMVLEDEGVQGPGVRHVDGAGRGGVAGHVGAPMPADGERTGCRGSPGEPVTD